MPLSRQHHPWIDVLRVIGCICVLITHVEYTGATDGRNLLVLIDFYAIIGFVPFFFVSGMLAFSSKKPMRQFIGGKVKRIVVPMLVWSVLYLLCMALMGNVQWDEVMMRVMMIPFQPQVPQFWFLYVVLGVFLVAPIINVWLVKASKRQVIFYLLLWGVTLFVPLLAHFLPDIASIRGEWGVLFYMQGYLGAMLFGYYLHRYVSMPKLPLWVISIAAILLALPLWYRYTGVPLALFAKYLSPDMIVLSCVLFVLVRNVSWPVWTHRALKFLGQATYGIYLMHMIVIRCCVLPIVEPLHLNYWFGIPLALSLAAGISILLVWMFSHLSCSWILGCDLKKN